MPDICLYFYCRTSFHILLSIKTWIKGLRPSRPPPGLTAQSPRPVEPPCWKKTGSVYLKLTVLSDIVCIVDLIRLMIYFYMVSTFHLGREHWTFRDCTRYKFNDIQKVKFFIVSIRWFFSLMDPLVSFFMPIYEESFSNFQVQIVYIIYSKMKIFRVSEKLCLPTSYFLWRI
jgi:hypothetical protein